MQRSSVQLYLGDKKGYTKLISEFTSILMSESHFKLVFACLLDIVTIFTRLFIKIQLFTSGITSELNIVETSIHYFRNDFRLPHGNFFYLYLNTKICKYS